MQPHRALGYVAGATILTIKGEVAVENLRPGDFVAIRAEHGWVPAIYRPLRFMIRRHFVLEPGGSDQSQPIRIRAGALNDGLPLRDLLLAPEQALLLPGGRVLARQLINGRSIVREAMTGPICYLHPMLDSRDAVVAEGVLGETWREDYLPSFQVRGPLIDLRVSPHRRQSHETAEPEDCPL
jgi:hypothetical protein